MLIQILIYFSLCAEQFPVIPEVYIKGYFSSSDDVLSANCKGNNASFNTFNFQCENTDPNLNYNPQYLYNVSASGINLIQSKLCPAGLNRVLNTCIPNVESSQYDSICDIYTGELKQYCLNMTILYDVSQSAGRPHPQTLQFLANHVAVQDYPLLNYPPYNSIFNNPEINYRGYTYWPAYLPFFAYLNVQASLSSVLDEIYLTSRYKFAQVSQFYLARYKWNGEFIGFTPLTVQLDKCGQKNDVSQIWRKFGTDLKLECYFDLTREMNDETNEFYELFIEDERTEEGIIMRPVPVTVNGRLGRRFYKYNNLTTAGVRIIESTVINFRIISSDSRSSAIETPYFSFRTRQIQASSLSQVSSDIRFKSNTDQHPKYTFEVKYSYSMSKLNLTFIILSSILAVFALIVIIARIIFIALSDGKYEDCVISFCKAIAFTFEVIGMYFFLVSFVFSATFLIFYKWQKSSFWCIPNNFEPFKAIKILIIISLICQFGAMLVRVFFVQLKNYFIIMDWETSDSDNTPVSAWRRINVSNELNRIVTIRSYNIPFTIISAIFILNGFNVEFLSTPIPTPALIDTGYSFWLLRFAVSALIWLILMAIQYLWFHYIYWRFYGNPYFNFLDICSTSNLSLFIVTSAAHGYYLHGKSVQGHSDADMKKLAQALVDEEEGLVGLRGIESNSPDQVFEVYFSNEFSLQISQMHEALVNQHRHVRFRLTANEISMDSLSLYSDINNFLKMFIEGTGDLKFSIQDPDLLQKITKIPPRIMTETIMNKIKEILYKRSLFAGVEWGLMISYLLIFCTIDMFLKSPAIAGFVVFCVDFLITNLYERLFRVNLAKTSLLDSRFLLT
ncbi:Meckelin [Tritrichomonas musculus]|uniref:Meckelin n=1 Tax=Tritrichomonas musculus TaxID=1915356 RepID=A0ABR2HFF6_9EUKA